MSPTYLFLKGYSHRDSFCTNFSETLIDIFGGCSTKHARMRYTRARTQTRAHTNRVSSALCVHDVIGHAWFDDICFDSLSREYILGLHPQ